MADLDRFPRFSLWAMLISSLSIFISVMLDGIDGPLDLAIGIFTACFAIWAAITLWIRRAKDPTVKS